MRPAVIETNLERLTENYHLIRAHADNRPVMAVVKANAYGHGLVRVAQHYESLGVEWLAVALLEEGVTLRVMPVPFTRYCSGVTISGKSALAPAI